MNLKFKLDKKKNSNFNAFTIPPPSTEIGIINSLGDFLIGCLSLVEPIVVDDDCMNE